MDKARFDTRGKLAHVLYALLIFVVGAAIAGATGKFGLPRLPALRRPRGLPAVPALLARQDHLRPLAMNRRHRACADIGG